MKKNTNKVLQEDVSQDHRSIAKDLDLYVFDNKAGQGLPILLPNWVLVRNKIQQLIRQKWAEYDFQEVITPILGSEELYQTSGHLDHYQDYMFPAISRNNETYYLRPMTCPHHCLIYQQKPRSYRELPFRLGENSILHRYETSGALKGLERVRSMELADHHIFVTPEQLKEEFKKSYYYITDVLTSLEFRVSRLVCSLHDPNNHEKYHSDENLWKYSEELLISSLNELNLNYVILKGEAAFYGPKLDIEIQTVDGKDVTVSTIQFDFVLPQKFDLNYIDKEQKLRTPVIIHQSPIGTYQRFISLLIEQTNGKLPFWLVPYQVAILPLNEKEEIKEYWEKLKKELTKNNLRVKILSEKSLNYRIRQVYQKKIPYYLVVGGEELEKRILKLICTYQERKKEELTEKELYNKLKQENSHE